MPISSGDEVVIHYTMKLESGTIVETTKRKDPLWFKLGMQDMPIGLEEALIGLSKGEKKIITIPPSKGFGERRESMIIELPKSNFEEEEKLAPNRLVEIISKEAVRYLGSVKDIKKDTVILDLNHPLAGETLIVDIEVVDFVPDENKQTTKPTKNGIDRSKTYKASNKKTRKEKRINS